MTQVLLSIRLLTFLVFVPLAVFVGFGLTNALGFVGLVTIVASRVTGMSAVRRQLPRFAIPLAVGLLGLEILFGSGEPATRLYAWSLATARFTTVLGFGLVFTATLRPLELPVGAERIGLPARYGMGLLIAYRLVPLLSDRLSSIILSQRARGARWRLSLTGMRQMPTLLASLVIPAVSATLELAVALSDVLFIRGYEPGRSLAARPREQREFWPNVALLLAGLSIVACAILERFL